jgi:putative tricarboxylic transport membrane protein
MDMINGLINVFTLHNLLYCFIGTSLGTLVGVLPGLGPSSTLAILLPITVFLEPTGAIIMLAGLCYGAMYGGSTTSILVNIPGEPASLPTCFDGYQMTRGGRAGQALWIAAVGSFIAGTLGVMGMSLIGPQIAKLALRFGPPEYCGLIFFSLTMIISLSGTALSKGIAVGLLGIFLAAVGSDPLTGIARLKFGSIQMTMGFDIIPVVVGLFGISQILESVDQGEGRIYEGALGKMMPRGAELIKGLKASFRGTLLGFPLGLIPGMTTALTAFLAYDVEKRISRYPEKFGTGVIEGVAAPEAANNATSQAGFIPLFSLGIPTAPSMAIVLAALMMYGLKPGPTLFTQDKVFVWTVIASMYVGNVMCLILNLPLVGLWARISLIPYKYLAPLILAVCVVGAYSPRNSMFDVWVSLVFGAIGFMMKKTHWPIPPLILGVILGPMLEVSLRQSLSMGGIGILFSRPIALGFIIATVITTWLLLRYARRVPETVLESEEKL